MFVVRELDIYVYMKITQICTDLIDLRLHKINRLKNKLVSFFYSAMLTRKECSPVSDMKFTGDLKR